MGTYTDLTVAGYPLISSKSAVVPEAMTIFRETDRHVFTRRVSERNALVWGEPEDTNDEETETVIEYSCETSKVIDRLNVMGFTLRRVREEFDTGRKAELEKYTSWAEEETDSKWFAEGWSFLKGLTFDAYVTAFAKVIADGLRPLPFDDHKNEAFLSGCLPRLLPVEGVASVPMCGNHGYRRASSRRLAVHALASGVPATVPGRSGVRGRP